MGGFLRFENKKFLETDYPRGRAIEVFRRFHFGLEAKNRPESFRDYILPHPEFRKGNSDLPEGEVKLGNPEAAPSGNYLDQKEDSQWLSGILESIKNRIIRY